MIYIIAGTNRPNSKTLQVAQIIGATYKQNSIPAEIMSLEALSDGAVLNAYSKGDKSPPPIGNMIEKLNGARGFHLVIPEYNGGMPGILKYFIDHFDYPKTFEWRPISFVGLGWRFGGLRPVEHAQQIFGYRNGFIYPQRVFIQNAPKIVTEGHINDLETVKILEGQVLGFSKFILALEAAKLDANSVNKLK